MKKLILFVAFILVFSGNGYGQQLWNKVSNPEALSSAKLKRDSNPAHYEIYTLNLDLLKSKLAAAPSRLANTNSPVVISFPNPEGKMQNYKMYEASVMAPELAKKHSEIQAYLGIGIDDPTASIRLTTTIFGLHTMTLSANGTSYIDPYTEDLKNYIIYSREGLTTSKSHFCQVNEKGIDVAGETNEGMQFRANNGIFKTYRLALSCTIEYAAFQINAAGVSGGTLAQKKAAVLAAMNVTMARVNGVYERDMALTMTLVANNEDIIFITSDGFSNENPAPTYPILAENQTVIDNVIGTANYDIGHIASTGAGGVASTGPCNANSKAHGATGTNSPVGDPYDIDYVAHEMGHQWGASHTFNSDQGSCSGNRVTSSAFEPGSGTTIMAYAGICSPDNVQQHSDAYFHARSLIQMQNYVTSSGTCGVAVPNGDAAPVVSAGSNYTIPFGTAFVLTGSATDTENDPLTYCWEQYNFQISEQPPLPGSALGPNFRSYSPTTSPSRYFPKLSDILANNLTPTWEVIPNVARSMAFSLVVRDNHPGPLGGQTERATMALTFANAGPFKVTSQNTVVSWPRNSSQVVTWDVAGTDANGINTQFVNIKLSTDGGLTFPYTLAENTLNDGNEAITVPSVAPSQTCRIKVEAVGNIYFAVNSATFLIGYEIINACTTYTYDGAAFSLPDGVNTYTIKTINVPTAGVISDVNITINATHPNLQNLNFAVVRPGGTTAVIYNQQCPGTANLNVTFDSQAPAFVCGSTGTYKPATGYDLNQMNNNNPFGDWRFGFKDMVAGNVGTIDSFSVEICSQTVRLATEDFDFKNFSLYPNPNTGNFTVQFDSASSQKINISVHDLRGRKIFDKSYNNTGMFSQNLQLDKAQAGIYLVSITDGDRKITKRIVIK